MTFTITLEPATQTVIERRAMRRGMSVAEYVEHMANSSVRKRKSTAGSALPRTPRETIEYWRNNQLINLFNDGPDSPQLAADLRRRAESRSAE